MSLVSIYKLSPNHVNLRTVSSSSFEVLGKFRLLITIADVTFYRLIFVVRNMSTSPILGRDFLSSNKSVLRIHYIMIQLQRHPHCIYEIFAS